MIAATILGIARPASAYTYHDAPSGAPARWDVASFDLVADPSLLEIDDGAVGAVRAALDAWESSGAKLPLVNLAPGAADAVGYVEGAVNHSTVRYEKSGDSRAGGALAITVLTFDAQGVIVDADIVVNGGKGRKFGLLKGGGKTEDDGTSRYDLQNVLTHELGHLFGLGEELENAEATMFVSSARGEIKKRTLETDDEEGVQLLYAASDLPAPGVGCAVSAGATESPWGAFVLVAGLAALFVRRPRRAAST